MAELKNWVEGPYSLISPSRSGAAVGKKLPPARAMAAEMSVVHNSLIRGINSVYIQCINVAERGTQKDKLDFANYAFQWTEALQGHHDHEEEALFPGINELAGVPGLMDTSVEEHAAFHDGLEKYAKYLQKVKEEKEELNGQTMKSLIESFMPALHTHLLNEIDTLVSLEKYDDKVNWIQWFNKEVDKMIKSYMSKSDYRVKVFPLGIVLHDKSFEGGVWQTFPPIPYLIALVLRWLFMYKYQDWWRFAGCDFTSQPKELPFA